MSLRRRGLLAVAVTMMVVTVGVVIGAAVIMGRGAPSGATPSADSSSGAAIVGAKPDVARPSASPTTRLDATAATAGFDGPYRFVARLADLPNMTMLGGIVEGDVVDPAHFVLDFPESGFVTRYTRSGADAVAVVGGRDVRVVSGAETFGSISPEDLMPGQLWSLVIEPWASMLTSGGAAGAFAAPTGLLTQRAHSAGYPAEDWQLSASTDGAGRLTSLTFRGVTYRQPFRLDLTVTYR
ncbi:MAG TPA: hypothetical protein VMU14_09000 [Acidimicrobiales bacterium]|nr:hypothetical protein [Acidimicrobiales bacterium]